MFSLRLLIHLAVLRPILRLFFGLNITGKDNLKGLEHFIIAANHNSHLDTPLLYSTLPLQLVTKTHPVAAKEYFAKPPWLFAVVSYLFRPIWVDRTQKGGGTVAKIRETVDGGHNVIIFPEGTRGEPGQLQDFKPGIGKLVESRRDIPVVPVFMLGPERALPKKSSFPLPLWNHVIVGLPQRLQGECADVTRSLQDSIENLARTEFAGRHKREPARRQSFAVAVLGTDGSGKSTLSRRLAVDLSGRETAGLISDSLEIYRDSSCEGMQPLLMEKIREWIGGQAKQAKSLARYKIPKLTELLLRDRLLDETKRWYNPDVIVMDGCPLLNMTAWAVLYREQYFNEDFCAKAMASMSGKDDKTADDAQLHKRFPELSQFKRLRLNRLKLPDAVIFLDVDPAVAMGRIEARGERKQVHETEEKLSRLRSAYLMVCDVIEREWQIPVHRQQGDRDIDATVSDALQFLEGVRSPENIGGVGHER